MSTDPITVARRRGALALVVAVALAACVVSTALLSTSSALATTGVWWHLGSSSFPTRLVPGEKGAIVVSAVNRGFENADGASTPITLTDSLPPGVKATAVRAAAGYYAWISWDEPAPECTLAPLSCTYRGLLKPYERMWMIINVEIAPGAQSGEASEPSVSGGGATSVSKEIALDERGGATEYGVERFELTPEDETGATVTQAGAHPFQLSTTIALDKTERLPFVNPDESAPLQPALPKDIDVKLPPGLVGNPTSFPECTAAQFSTHAPEASNACPQNTAIGYTNTIIDEPNLLGLRTFRGPIFNLVPEHGEPARFGYTVFDVPVYLDTYVRTGGDYGVTVHVGNISQLSTLLESEVTIWGVPGDTRHDESRGWDCGISEEAEFGGVPCTHLEEKHPQPLLVMPTSCTGSLQASVETDSWKEPQRVQSHQPSEALPAMDGCNRLGFEPSIEVTPDTQAGSTPSGLNVDVHVPQSGSTVPTGLSESHVKDTTVTLPEGLVLNPAGADGLQSCSEAQIGLSVDAGPSCPDASKVGTVTIRTPLLPNALTGDAYLAAQDANPFGSLVALYVYAEDPQSGTKVKLAGEVHLTETGQIVSTFKDTPQLPFEDFELHFFGGDRAPLATPGACGAYTTTASMAPWSGNAPASTSSTFDIASGPNGSACQSPPPFTPTLTGGTTSIQAGGFSPFTMTMSREDGQQSLQSVTLKMPGGLSGVLTGVELCGEAQADAGTCGPGSLIGETIVSVGLGGDPFSVTGGKVYLTGPYRGAPFGLSIVNPAKAGPFDLGQVVVRAKIEVDPATAALTVTTDKDGPYAIPQVLQGIPLQIKHVNVTIDRPKFTFNPTSCNPLGIGASIASAQGADANVQVPFQVANCANLAFKPGFAVSTSGKTSRADGASLHVRLTYPGGSLGNEANIAKVKVELPKRLPSRLSTLQKACTAAQFAASPAGCPAASIVGHAKAITPILPVPLEGPAYFVSHGGEAFPSLIVVLQGYGVTVDLVGTTFISKKGITSSTFATVPDVPVGSFELTLPERPYSALAANGNLCRGTLAMPTEFVAQNGIVLHRSTKIQATGCQRATKARHKQRKAPRTKRAHRTKGGAAARGRGGQG